MSFWEFVEKPSSQEMARLQEKGELLITQTNR